MSKQVNCECGAIVRGETDEDLVEAVTKHVDEHHPDLVGKLSRQDILDMSEET
jgi:hypothetical protein